MDCIGGMQRIYILKGKTLVQKDEDNPGGCWDLVLGRADVNKSQWRLLGLEVNKSGLIWHWILFRAWWSFLLSQTTFHCLLRTMVHLGHLWVIWGKSLIVSFLTSFKERLISASVTNLNFIPGIILVRTFFFLMSYSWKQIFKHIFPHKTSIISTFTYTGDRVLWLWDFFIIYPLSQYFTRPPEYNCVSFLTCIYVYAVSCHTWFDECFMFSKNVLECLFFNMWKFNFNRRDWKYNWI